MSINNGQPAPAPLHSTVAERFHSKNPHYQESFNKDFLDDVNKFANQRDLQKLEDMRSRLQSKIQASETRRDQYKNEDPEQGRSRMSIRVDHDYEVERLKRFDEQKVALDAAINHIQNGTRIVTKTTEEESRLSKQLQGVVDRFHSKNPHYRESFNRAFLAKMNRLANQHDLQGLQDMLGAEDIDNTLKNNIKKAEDRLEKYRQEEPERGRTSLQIDNDIRYEVKRLERFAEQEKQLNSAIARVEQEIKAEETQAAVEAEAETGEADAGVEVDVSDYRTKMIEKIRAGTDLEPFKNGLETELIRLKNRKKSGKPVKTGRIAEVKAKIGVVEDLIRQSKTASQSVETRVLEAKHDVVGGDTLSKILKKFQGEGVESLQRKEMRELLGEDVRYRFYDKKNNTTYESGRIDVRSAGPFLWQGNTVQVENGRIVVVLNTKGQKNTIDRKTTLNFVPKALPVESNIESSRYRYAVEAGVYNNKKTADAFAEQLEKYAPVTVDVEHRGGREYHVVRVGDLPSRDAADDLLKRLNQDNRKALVGAKVVLTSAERVAKSTQPLEPDTPPTERIEEKEGNEKAPEYMILYDTEREARDTVTTLQEKKNIPATYREDTYPERVMPNKEKLREAAKNKTEVGKVITDELGAASLDANIVFSFDGIDYEFSNVDGADYSAQNPEFWMGYKAVKKDLKFARGQSVTISVSTLEPYQIFASVNYGGEASPTEHPFSGRADLEKWLKTTIDNINNNRRPKDERPQSKEEKKTGTYVIELSAHYDNRNQARDAIKKFPAGQTCKIVPVDGTGKFAVYVINIPSKDAAIQFMEELKRGGTIINTAEKKQARPASPEPAKKPAPPKPGDKAKPLETGKKIDKKALDKMAADAGPLDNGKDLGLGEDFKDYAIHAKQIDGQLSLVVRSKDFEYVPPVPISIGQVDSAAGIEQAYANQKKANPFVSQTLIRAAKMAHRSHNVVKKHTETK